ncbi:hypothetical protein ABBQ38_005082 [Trebouxia sp. C0009 RCD-2024]
MFFAWLVQVKRAFLAGASPCTPERIPFGNITNSEVPSVPLFWQLSCSVGYFASYHQPATVSRTAARSLNQAPAVVYASVV